MTSRSRTGSRVTGQQNTTTVYNSSPGMVMPFHMALCRPSGDDRTDDDSKPVLTRTRDWVLPYESGRRRRACMRMHSAGQRPRPIGEGTGKRGVCGGSGNGDMSACQSGAGACLLLIAPESRMRVSESRWISFIPSQSPGRGRSLTETCFCPETTIFSRPRESHFPCFFFLSRAPIPSTSALSASSGRVDQATPRCRSGETVDTQKPSRLPERRARNETLSRGPRDFNWEHRATSSAAKASPAPPSRTGNRAIKDQRRSVARQVVFGGVFFVPDYYYRHPA